jgi:hypothetical protein
MSTSAVTGAARAPRVGRMTAAMRAVTPSAPRRVLRVGLVVGARMVDERVMKRAAPVTIGTDEGATLVIASDAAPARFALFEPAGDTYRLRVARGMTGRVALGGDVVDVGALAGRSIDLSDDARGKIVVGDAVVLFQLVAPAPPASRARLPLSVQEGVLGRVDWALTVIAAFSFLVHFGLVGAMCSDWMDPIVDEGIDVRGLVELDTRVVAPTVEAPVDDTPAATATQVTPAATGGPPTQRPRQEGTHCPQPIPTSEAVAAALSRQADAIGFTLLGALHASSAVQAALARGEAPIVDLSGPAAENRAASAVGGDLHLGGGAAIVATGKPGLGVIAGPGAAGASRGGGALAPVTGPRVDVSTGEPKGTVPVPRAEAVVARLRPRLRRCYEAGLAADAAMSGAVTMTVKIAPNGEVQSASGSPSDGLSAGVVECLARALRDAQFDPPGPAGSTLQVPVKLVQQAR